MIDLEVQLHLKDCLFHGVQKLVCDSVQYLYSTPRTSYSQLMVATHKAESQSEEIWDKVKARAAVATAPGEATAELGQQIVKLMAGLTKAGQGSNPSSMPSSPWERGHGRGHNGSNTPKCPNSHKGRSGPGQTIPACSLPTGHRAGDNGTGSNGQSNQVNGTRREGTANRWDPNSLQCCRCQGWGHMARECPTPVSASNQPRGNQGNVAHPLLVKAAPASNRPYTSLTNLGQRPAGIRAAQQTGPRETTPIIPFLNPDPIAHLVGSNEAPVIVDGQKVTALID